MNTSCEIIKDLLPLYAENLTSEQSKKLVEEHLNACTDCQNALDVIKSEYKFEEKFSLDSIKKEIDKRRLKAIVFSCLVLFFSLFIIFSNLTKPLYLSEGDSFISISEDEDGSLHANFGKNISGYEIDSLESGAVYISAWTTQLHEMFTAQNSNPTESIALSVPLSNYGADIHTVYYGNFSYSTDIDSLTKIYSESDISQTQDSSGVAVLPRLVLASYFTLALIATVLGGVVWLILGLLKKKAAVIGKVLCLLPASYLISHLFVTTSFATYSLVRDFSYNTIGAFAVFGILFLGINLFKQYWNDRKPFK